jgi:hypothetical protein
VKDPIVEEVRAIRAKIAEECGYDLQRMLDHAQEVASKIPGLRYVTRVELEAMKRGEKMDSAKAKSA